MTELEAIAQMEKFRINSENDTEMGHVDADGLLCEFLTGLGYLKLVEKYKEVDKWYA